MELTPRIMEKIESITKRMYDKYQPTSIDLDDLKQECYIYVLSADNDFANIDSAIISKCETVIRNTGFAVKIEKSDLRKDAYVSFSAESLSTHKNDLRYNCDMDVLAIAYDIVKAFELLSDRDKLLVYMRLYMQYDLNSTAKVFNVTRERIRQLESKVIRAIRRSNTLFRHKLYDFSLEEFEIIQEKTYVYLEEMLGAIKNDEIQICISKMRGE